METARQNPHRFSGPNGKDSGTPGKLKLFFSYSAGLGETDVMLRSARGAKERGIDVAVGCISPRSRPGSAVSLDDLERLSAEDGLDMDAVLKRRPGLLLVDDLAHTNAPGSRNARRYQDVQELLQAGIDVYTTLNVQNIESLSDTVASITGAETEERIPDSVFDGADQVELVDAEPEELLDRLAGGERPAFFTVENLTALRELALRRCADRISLRGGSAGHNRDGYHAEEHILVCLSSSPSNARIIRTAARMARAFRGQFTALFVETPDTAAMEETDKRRLRENTRLAQQLGASVETSFGEDVPYQIAEFARLSGVSKIVIGRSTAARRWPFGKPTLTERLIVAAPNLDIHVIPDTSAESGWRARRKLPRRVSPIPLRDIGKTALVLLAATLVSYAFYTLGFTDANIIAVYLFAVLVCSVITTSPLCGLLASVVSVLVFNFFFTAPRFSFRFSDPNYLVTMPIMFMVALLTGSLATRLKDSARQSAQAAFRTKVLFETNQLLQKESEEPAVLEAMAGQITKLLGRSVVVYPSNGKELSVPRVYRAADNEDRELTSEQEKAAATWVLRNNKHAGATTDTLSDTRCLYLAIRTGSRVYGVVGIAMEGAALAPFENSVLLSILGECALALEGIRSAREKEEAAVLAKNEQLRANLLRSISHDLRTPLTSISGSAGNLLANYEKMDEADRVRAFTDIYDDAQWLINLVENLLAITRIEGGRVSLNQSVELMDEVVAEALQHIDRHSGEHRIQTSTADDLILAKIDAKLIVQVLINLVDNAIKYTPAGSEIQINTEKKRQWVVVTVSDNGPGIPDEQKLRVFEMFYSGANRAADSRRSLGLGLALCRSIVTAHGGTISVSNNLPHGTVFTFTLPAGEVDLHE